MEFYNIIKLIVHKNNINVKILIFFNKFIKMDFQYYK